MGYGIRVSTKPAQAAPPRTRPDGSRITLCRYLRGKDPVGERCTGEAIDPHADIHLCARHTALVLELVTAAAASRKDTP